MTAPTKSTSIQTQQALAAAIDGRAPSAGSHQTEATIMTATPYPMHGRH
jgi:hypothetical protein